MTPLFKVRRWKRTSKEYWEEIAREVLGEPRESGALEAKWGKHFKEELAIDCQMLPIAYNEDWKRTIEISNVEIMGNFSVEGWWWNPD